jgi:hypothetical protein
VSKATLATSARCSAWLALCDGSRKIETLPENRSRSPWLCRGKLATSSARLPRYIILGCSHSSLLKTARPRGPSTSRAWDFFRRLGDRRLECNVLLALARETLARNDVETARGLVAEASIACQESATTASWCACCNSKRRLPPLGEEFEQTIRLTAAAEKMIELLGTYVHPATAGTPHGESARFLADARGALGEQRFALGVAPGRHKRRERRKGASGYR